MLWALVALRAAAAALPGYVHPDEWFQSPEAAASASPLLAACHARAGAVRAPWEFTASAPGPVRPFWLPEITSGLAYRLVAATLGCPASPWLLVLLPRAASLVMSLALDWAVVRVCRAFPRVLSERAALLALGTAWPVLVLCVRPLGNSVECAVAAVCLAVSSSLALRPLRRGQRLLHSAALGLLVSVGVFARPTFVAWAVPMGLFCVAGLLHHCGVYALLEAAVAVAGAFVVAPLKFAAYNSDQANLALHGLHPRWLHAVVNLPVLFLPLAILAAVSAHGERQREAGAGAGAGRARGGAGHASAFAGLRQQHQQAAAEQQARSIESSLQAARHSGVLNLSDRSLQEAPRQIWAFNTLVFQEDKCTSESWWELEELKRLDLSRNEIAAIPEEKDEAVAETLPALAVVNLSANRLEAMPRFLLLPTLASLDLTSNGLSALPEEMAERCPRLADLHVGDNRLEALPQALPESLATLDLRCNGLVLIDAVAHLRSLRSLDVSQNRLTEVPVAFSSLVSLEELNLSKNAIHSLPDLRGLSALHTADLSYNELRALPAMGSSLRDLKASHNRIAGLSREFCTSCPKLQSLELRENYVVALENYITSLRSLVRLDLTNNSIATLNPVLANMDSLSQLLLTGNPLKTLRSGLLERGTAALKDYLRSRLDGDPDAEGGEGRPSRSSLPTKMDLVRKQLTAVPAEVLAAGETLTALDLNRNAISDVPADFAMLRGLQSLNVSLNRFEFIPQPFLQLGALTRLEAGGNKISELPQDFQQLGNLQELVLAGNAFKTFPQCLLSMKLVVLDLSTNKIQRIPPEISNMQTLATLDLSSNDLTSLPAELGLITTLQLLKFEGNLIRSLPRI
eukprot:m51a1_g6752 hypothetical protein (857) ;mRNA; f:39527-46344